eukprot:PhF_6_TR31857/c1_g1_i1/m.47248
MASDDDILGSFSDDFQRIRNSTSVSRTFSFMKTSPRSSPKPSAPARKSPRSLIIDETYYTPDEYRLLQLDYEERVDEVKKTLDFGFDLLKRIKVLNNELDMIQEDIHAHRSEMDASTQSPERQRNWTLECELRGLRHFEYAFQTKEPELRQLQHEHHALASQHHNLSHENKNKETEEVIEFQQRTNAELWEKLSVWVLPKNSPMQLAFTRWIQWAHPRAMNRLQQFIEEQRSELAKWKEEEREINLIKMELSAKLGDGEDEGDILSATLRRVDNYGATTKEKMLELKELVDDLEFEWFTNNHCNEQDFQNVLLTLEDLYIEHANVLKSELISEFLHEMYQDEIMNSQDIYLRRGEELSTLLEEKQKQEKSLKSQLSELLQHVETVTTELEAHKADYEKEEHHLVEEESRLQSLTERIAAVEHEKQEMQQKIDNLRLSCEELLEAQQNVNVAEAKEYIQDMIAEIKKTQVAVASVEDVKASLEDRCNQLRVEKMEVDGDVQSKREIFSLSVTEREMLETDISELKEKLSVLHKSVQEDENHLMTVCEQVGNIQQVLTEKANALPDLKLKVDNLSQLSETIESEIAENVASLEETKAQIVSYEDNIHQLQESETRLRQETAMILQDVSNKRRQHEAVERDIETALRNINTLVQNYSLLDREKVSLEGNLEGDSVRIAQSHAGIEDLIQENVQFLEMKEELMRQILVEEYSHYCNVATFSVDRSNCLVRTLSVLTNEKRRWLEYYQTKHHTDVLRHKAAALENRMNGYEARHFTIQSDLDKVHAEKSHIFNEHEQIVEQLKADIFKSEQEIDARFAQLRLLQRNTDELTTTCDVLIFDVQKLRDENQDCSDVLFKTETDFDAKVKATNEAAMVKLRQRLEEENGWKSKIDALGQEYEKIRDEFDIQKKSNRTILSCVQREVNNSTSAAKDFEKHIAQLERGTVQNMTAQTLEEIHHLQLLLEQQKGSLASVEHEVHGLETILTTGRHSVATLQSEVLMTENKIHTDRETLGKTLENTTRVQQDCANWIREKERFHKKELSQAVEELSSVVNACDQLRTSVPRLRGEVNSSIEDTRILEKSLAELQSVIVSEHTKHGDEIRRLHKVHDEAIAAIRIEKEVVDAVRSKYDSVVRSRSSKSVSSSIGEYV